MTFWQSVRSALAQYATFSGRACRSEFFWFHLFLLLVAFVTITLDESLGTTTEGRWGGRRGALFLVVAPSLRDISKRRHRIIELPRRSILGIPGRFDDFLTMTS